MKLVALLLSLAVASSGAVAQQRGGDREPRGGGKIQGTSKDQRERMRQDMRNVYRDKGSQRAAPPPQRQMTPQEREQLRRDIQDANRSLRR